jgi:hypothetical protein
MAFPGVVTANLTTPAKPSLAESVRGLAEVDELICIDSALLHMPACSEIAGRTRQPVVRRAGAAIETNPKWILAAEPIDRFWRKGSP